MRNRDLRILVGPREPGQYAIWRGQVFRAGCGLLSFAFAYLQNKYPFDPFIPIPPVKSIV